MKNLMRMACITSAALGVVFAAPVSAQTAWPSKPVRMVIPGSPGTSSDLLARMVFDPVGKAIGQPVVIDYKPGAGTTLAADHVAKAAPDGATFLLASIAALAIAPTLYANLPYDPMKDLTHVALLVKMPNLLVVGKDSPVRSVRELIANAKANPGKLNYGSSGSGTSFHLSAVLLSQMTGIDIVHVPYKGNVILPIMSGEIQLAFDNMITALPQVRAGAVRALAISTATRSPDVPDVPTMIEAGVPGFDVGSWFGTLAPTGTPPAIVDRMSAEIARSMSQAEVADALRKLGAQVAYLRPQEFAAFNRAEIARWAPVVKASGATP